MVLMLYPITELVSKLRKLIWVTNESTMALPCYYNFFVCLGFFLPLHGKVRGLTCTIRQYHGFWTHI